MNAKARAQADEALEEAARILKRNQNAVRSAVQLVRQAQANLVGVEVETIPSTQLSEGEQSARSEDQAAAA